ncbi:MAG: hypothetical protein ACKOW9_01805 [Candidatus Paceibacterota bacterium]
MPSSPKKHPNLISYAEGVALDILFSKGGNVSAHFKAAPSSDLLRERWSKLTADLAISLATVITDQELIDEILLKEKRKTVLEALNRNQNMHSCSRLYLLQRAFVLDNFMRVRDIFVNFPLLEKLEMARDDKDLRRYINTYNLAEEILQLEPQELERAFALAYEIDDDIVSGMIKVNGQVALDLITKHEIPLKNHNFASAPSVDTPVETIRTFLQNAGDRRSYAIRVARDYRYDLKKLIEIDDALVDLLNDYEMNLENVTTLVSNGKIKNVIDRIIAKYQVDDEVADYLLSSGVDELTRCILAFRYSDPKRSAELMVNGTQLSPCYQAAAQLLDRYSRRWLRDAAPFLTEKQIIDALQLVPDALELDDTTLTHFANLAGKKIDDYLLNLPKEVFLRITSLPSEVNFEKILLHMAKDHEAYDKVIYLALRHSEIPDSVKHAVASHVLRSEDQTRIQNWLSRSDLATIEEALKNHRSTITRNIFKLRPHNIPDGVIDLVISDLIPNTNWGMVTQHDILSAVMNRLKNLIGSEDHLWETVLALFPTWTGSVDALVQAARDL